MTADRRRTGVACADFEDAVSDLAIGGVAEPLRSTLLAHADSCASCAAALADVVAIGDALLHIAPSVEPPAGFESRAIARMTDGAPARVRSGWASRLAGAVAVVVALVAGVIAGQLMGVPGGDEVASGPIVATSGDRMGTAELSVGEGGTSRIILTMNDDGGWIGAWICQLLDDEGDWVDVASWSAHEVNERVWATGVPKELEGAERMRIINDRGRVVATAKLD